MTEETGKLNPLFISVHDSILISEWLVVGLIVEKIIIWETNPKNSELLVSIAEYRKLLKDDVSTDKQITARLQYLEAFCRNIIKLELQKYGKS